MRHSQEHGPEKSVGISSELIDFDHGCLAITHNFVFVQEGGFFDEGLSEDE